MWIEEYVAMASRNFCPTCGAAPGPSDRFCASCGGALVEKPPPHVALMLLAYLACAPLAWGLMLFMLNLNDDPSDTRTGAQVDAALRTATKVAIVVALVGAVVLLIPLARRMLRIRTIGRAIVILDGAVAAGTFFGFAYG
jgi:predicted nucleic acid-binding Zn ribbon protein